MSIKKISSKLTKQMERIARERDKLDGLISEAEELKDRCDQAYNDLWRARDALSELV